MYYPSSLTPILGALRTRTLRNHAYERKGAHTRLFTAALLIAKNFGNNSNIYQQENGYINVVYLYRKLSHFDHVKYKKQAVNEWTGTVVILFMPKSKYLKIIAFIAKEYIHI